MRNDRPEAGKAKRGNHEGHEGRTYELLGQLGAGWAKGAGSQRWIGDDRRKAAGLICHAKNGGFWETLNDRSERSLTNAALSTNVIHAATLWRAKTNGGLEKGSTIVWASCL